MNFYSADAIRAVASCEDIAVRMFGAVVKDGRCNASWRGGKKVTNVSIEKDKWYDHKLKKGGGIFELVREGKNCNFPDAVEILGEFYNLKKDVEIRDGRKKVAEYVYTNEKDEPVHKTVRYNLSDGEKEFVQYRYEKNEWVLGLGEIETIPYHVKNLTANQIIHVHEGEKACDSAIQNGVTNSTSLCMGSGKWFPFWSKWFVGKDVVIVRDNDDAGYAHGERLAWELKSVAKSIKLITPSKVTKGDAYEYFHDEGGSKESFEKMVADTPVRDAREIQEPKEAKEDKSEIGAKEANKTPFANYTMTYELKPDGGKTAIKVSRSIKEMLEDLNVRLMGFPKRVGSVMFDRDRKTGRIRNIISPTDLIAWISEKTKHNVRMGKIEGAISAEQLYSSVYANCQQYSMISGVPHYPVRSDVYYTHGTLPEATEDAYYFNKFCSFFCPAADVDHLLLKVAIASPLFYDEAISKPLFVVDSIEGAGVGKSKFVDMVCQLYGDPYNPETFSPIDIQPEALANENNIERVFKRVLSSTARQKRIIRIDNATGFFKSDVISTICTSSYISGMSPYARGEEARANDLSIFITSNQAHLSSDFVSRGFMVHLKRPTGRGRNWEYNIKEFLKAHQYNIIADIIGLLKRGKLFDIKGYMLDSRFKAWEDKVMIPILSDEREYQLIWEATSERRREADGELFESEIIRETLEDKIRELCGAEYDRAAPIWINWDVVNYLCQKAIPGIGGKTGRGLRHILKNAIVSGKIQELSFEPVKFPTKADSKRKRGIMWDTEGIYREAHLKNKSLPSPVKIVKFVSDYIALGDEQ